MWWHIIVFSIIFALCAIEGWQLVRLTKHMRWVEEKLTKHNDAILRILRGF